MLGLSTAVVPVAGVTSVLPTAGAQTQNDAVPAINADGVKNGLKLARYSDGRLVSLSSSPNIKGSQTEGTPTYEYGGQTYERVCCTIR